MEKRLTITYKTIVEQKKTAYIFIHDQIHNY